MLAPFPRNSIIGLCAALLCGATVTVGAQSVPGAYLQVADATGLRAFPGSSGADALFFNEFALVSEQSGAYAREPRRTSSSGARRLGLADTETSNNVHYALDENWTSRIVTGGTAPSDPLLRQTVHGQLERSLPGGWGVGLGLRRNDYLTATTNALSMSAERQWGDFRAGYTLISGLPDGQSTESHRFQLSYEYSDRSSFGLAYTSGRDLDYLGSARGLAATDVNNWSLGGQHRLTQAWALTYDMLRGTQSSLTPRPGLRLGLRHDF